MYGSRISCLLYLKSYAIFYDRNAIFSFTLYTFSITVDSKAYNIIIDMQEVD